MDDRVSAARGVGMSMWGTKRNSSPTSAGGSASSADGTAADPAANVIDLRQRLSSVSAPRNQAVHDTRKRHDTHRVHDLTKVHDTTRVHRSLSVTSPPEEAAPAPGAEAPVSQDSAPTQGPALADEEESPAFSRRERDAWQDLEDELARVTRLLQREIEHAKEAPLLRLSGPAVAPQHGVPVRPAEGLSGAEHTSEPTVSLDRPSEPTSRPARTTRTPPHVAATALPAAGEASRGSDSDAPARWVMVAVGALAMVSFGLFVAALRIDGPAEAPGGRTVSSDGAGAARPADVNALAAWLARSTDDGTRVVAPRALLEQLRSALPGRKVTGFAHARPGVLVVDLARQSRDAPAPTARPAGNSEVVARFPSGVTVRQLGVGGREARVDRSAMSRRLLADTDVRLTPRAWSRLADGAVDRRLLGLLDRVARTHTIDVAAFPWDPRERAAGAPARTMRVTAIDGLLVRDAEADIHQLRAVLLSQPGDVRPDSVTARRAAEPPVLVVRVLLPSTTS